MIYGNIAYADRYASLHPLLPQLFAYVKSHDLLHTPMGKIVLDGDKLFINNVNPECLSEEKQVLEVHRRYIDVHILLEGKERVGWRNTDDCKELAHPYDEGGDFATFFDKPTTYIDMMPNDFLIVFPEDAHAPIIGSGKIRKAIAKVML
ncbi:MAG: YhcH/YjgK/YiaL family protein [Prevotella sp.]|nr:YhcH/YjgK/YiaL family protein [Bacteroidales bacterium]MDY4229083.1 YhcH/YjgK/YiaL family protein [Prevotella sp.]